ncbi:M28 family peptidase [Rhodohalobacter mucosus]|nr:M28 family peptidase [Rhodohalobacter mucosus]
MMRIVNGTQFSAYGNPIQVFLLLLVTVISACSTVNSERETEEFLREHIEWLSGEERAGRLAGSAEEAATANYLENIFLQFGLEPAGDEDTYVQQFVLSGPMPEAMGVENYQSRNVLGLIRGTEFQNQYIIVGAHYDGQGNGGMISMNHGGEPSIHYSADDNASGTSGLLLLAKRFAENPARRSVLFAAFSGEELGLIGSRHMADHLEMPRDSLLAMINLDMIGRLDGSGVTIFGTGTSSAWSSILRKTPVPDSLTIVSAPSGTGASDHTSFYDINIPVLHYFSGIHDQYHRESDTAELIDYTGMMMILDHAEGVVRNLAEYSPEEVTFTETAGGRPEGMPSGTVTLGVFPDYTWSGNGFRLDGVNKGSVAERGGIEPGDVIIRMDDMEITDIYDYMEALAEFSIGQSVDVIVNRNGETVELRITF